MTAKPVESLGYGGDATMDAGEQVLAAAAKQPSILRSALAEYPAGVTTFVRAPKACTGTLPQNGAALY
jgi:hypothetical protein